MKKGLLSDFYSPEDKETPAFIYTPLLKAMAAGVKELEVTPDEFVIAMRSAVLANIYQHVFPKKGADYPTILAMKVTII